jgi:hypothetical protein
MSTSNFHNSSFVLGYRASTSSNLATHTTDRGNTAAAALGMLMKLL